ncbi:hypothetical protein [Nocardia bovistercoris]|uniref:Uncharacterized protein n=1 Tax=Nocardia bovistercoris TaxID=2785916 RepID=A0A931N2N6_9NOCA|nr:hypothetical protein [Nocardia bovistercoris]MBH0776241.1 hypothetical protein [Nocardia bovistercoris]
MTSVRYGPCLRLGGCACLFVRGMIAAGTPSVCGVSRWRALDTLMAADLPEGAAR